MTLATYKSIFFWEWVHRLLARTIGMVFAVPLAWFWLRGHSGGLQAASSGAAGAGRASGRGGLVDGQVGDRP
jgi:heme A synthase